MREIKFRGKSKGTWVVGNYIKTGMGMHYIIPQNVIANDVPQFLVSKESVGQYTGLEDKNGVEIYEGDIVKLFQGIYLLPHKIGSIFYDQEYFGWAISLIVHDQKAKISIEQHFQPLIEVIGNIYEHPHLLEVQND